MKTHLAAIEKIIGKELLLAPARDGDPLATLMACKDNTAKYALDEAGRLIGLNLANAGLTDVKWDKIVENMGAEMEHFRALHLADNKLTKFPFDVTGGYRKMERLNLAGNTIKIFFFPEPMLSLTLIDLEENPLENIPPELVKLGNKEILKWLNASNKRPILEAKVMFIGDSNYGKTHLIEMLLNRKLTKEITTTHGIDRCKMKDAPSKEGNIQLNVWDLGGQQFMRSTHQFFFTERTLYVLVTVARRERKDLNHWLQLIHEIGNDAPVLVVINKTDLDDHDIDREPLKREYPNIVDFVRTAVFDNKAKGIVALDTIQTLENKIHQIVVNKDIMPEVFVEQRNEWFTVKKELEDMKEDYISYEDYRKLNHISSLSNEDQKSNLKQLALLGTVVSFVDDPRLSDTHVINPQWIMDGVYTLINDAEVKDNRRGKFSFSDFTRLLSPKRYPQGKYPFLVDLMKKFKLCYQVRSDENTFLLPDLFSDIEPENVWGDKETDLRFRLNYGAFPPDLFMSQFIAERYADIVDEKRWRSGVVITNEKCKAIVRRSFSNEYIEIEVRGPEKQQRSYLSEILSVFRELHRPFENLKIAREIPFEGSWLNYDHLLKYEERNQTYFHPELDKEIPVTSILNGYESPDDRGGLGEQLQRIEKTLDQIALDTKFLKNNSTSQADMIEKIFQNKYTQDTFFSKMEKGMDELLAANLPKNDPILPEIQRFKTEPEIKTKIKIGLNLLVLAIETEVNWNMKELFKEIVHDMKNGHFFLKP